MDPTGIIDESPLGGGVKLPYFHRVQTQEEKDLIGDITPKPITTDTTTSTTSSAKSGLASATWNTAETWEERDCSDWSRQKMQGIFGESFECTSGGYRVVLSSLDNLKGSSQVTHVRGKARFFYDYSFDLSFEIFYATGERLKGKLIIEDVCNDQLDDMEISLQWTSKPPANSVFSSVKRALSGGDMKGEVKRKMILFENAFKQI